MHSSSSSSSLSLGFTSSFFPISQSRKSLNPNPRIQPSHVKISSSRRRYRTFFPISCQPASSAPDTSIPTSPSSPPSPPPRIDSLRKLLAFLSAIGFSETVYLTYNKIFSSPGAICATQGCLDVLTGPFSSFLGIPLTLFGSLAYLSFAYLCIYPLSAAAEINPDGVVTRSAEIVYLARDVATRPLMLALATVLFTFSSFLMGLLLFVIRDMCPYCVFSAALSTTIFVITAFVARVVPNFTNAIKVGALSTAGTAVVAAAVFFLGWPAHISAQPPNGELQSPPEVTMKSTSETMRIAGKLRAKKTRMYGAYWCSHCYDQKQRFGKKAFGMIEYIECDQHGVDTKYKLCREKRIKGYPTWEIDGELYPGEIEPPELERLADTSGSN